MLFCIMDVIYLYTKEVSYENIFPSAPWNVYEKKNKATSTIINLMNIWKVTFILNYQITKQIFVLD